MMGLSPFLDFLHSLLEFQLRKCLSPLLDCLLHFLLVFHLRMDLTPLLGSLLHFLLDFHHMMALIPLLDFLLHFLLDFHHRMGLISHMAQHTKVCFLSQYFFSCFPITSLISHAFCGSSQTIFSRILFWVATVIITNLSLEGTQVIWSLMILLYWLWAKG